MLTRRQKPAPARRDRSDEFVSFAPARARARMVTADDLAPTARPLETAARPARPTTRAKTTAEAEYMGRVAALGCVVCRLLGYGPTPAQVHHVRAGQGKAQRAGNFCVVPLCEPHHTGRHGVHGDRACLRQVNADELDLLDMTIRDVMAGTHKLPSPTTRTSA